MLYLLANTSKTMTRNLFFICLFTLCLLGKASWVHATTYYICNGHTVTEYNGLDSQDGLTPETAWQTYAYAHQQFPNLQAGDHLAFCRGGHFQTTSQFGHNFSNSNSTASNPITFTSYIPDVHHSSCEQLPEISDVMDHTIIKFTERIHEEGFVIEELHLTSSPPGHNNNGIAFLYDVDHVLIRNVEISHLGTAVYAGDGGDYEDGGDGLNSNIHLEGLYIRDNSKMGFIGKSDNLIIEDSVFINNAFEHPIFGHHLYVTKAVHDHDYDNFPYITTNQVIRNNWFYRNAIDDHDNDPLTPDECNAGIMSIHGVARTNLIEGNVIWEDPLRSHGTCYGIAVNPGYNYKYPEGFAHTIIRNNIVKNVGRNAILCNACDQSEITQNLILAQSADAGINGILIGQDENDYSPCTNGIADQPPGCILSHAYDLLDKTQSASINHNRIVINSGTDFNPSIPILAGDDDGNSDHFEFSHNISWYASSGRVNNDICTQVASSDSQVNTHESCQEYDSNQMPQQILDWEAEAQAAINQMPATPKAFFRQRGLFDSCLPEQLFHDGFE